MFETFALAVYPPSVLNEQETVQLKKSRSESNSSYSSKLKNPLITDLKLGTICIVGLGRIGLPTATMFASSGNKVLGVDINPAIVRSVNSGISHIVDERGLAKLLKTSVRENFLTATQNTKSAICQADFIIVCVPTPVDGSKTPDYSAIMSACRDVGSSMKKGATVIIESTVGPLTVETLIRPILETESKMIAGVDFGLASCPERSDPGKIIQDMKSIPRVVGGINSHYEELVASLYENSLNVRVVRMGDIRTANAVKLVENLFRDVNIALMSEFAILFESLEIDVVKVINACSTKYNFLAHYPGAGVGGPCLPSNSYYLIAEAAKVGYIPKIIRLAREINDKMPQHAAQMVSDTLNEIRKSVNGSQIAVYGATYKEGVRDLQNSPMAQVCKSLVESGAQIQIYDPMFSKGELVFGLEVVDDVYDVAKDKDCLVFGTADKLFSEISLPLLYDLSNHPSAIVDTRHMIDRSSAEEAGFVFRGVGRPIDKKIDR